MTNKNKRITRRQRLLSSVIEENKMLREKIKSLERDVEIEKEKPNKGYEKVQKIYDECEKTRVRYLALVKETEKLNTRLKHEIENVKLLKTEYRKRINDASKNFQKDLRI